VAIQDFIAVTAINNVLGDITPYVLAEIRVDV